MSSPGVVVEAVDERAAKESRGRHERSSAKERDPKEATRPRAAVRPLAEKERENRPEGGSRSEPAVGSHHPLVVDEPKASKEPAEQRRHDGSRAAHPDAESNRVVWELPWRSEKEQLRKRGRGEKRNREVGCGRVELSKPGGWPRNSFGRVRVSGDRVGGLLRVVVARGLASQLRRGRGFLLAILVSFLLVSERSWSRTQCKKREARKRRELSVLDSLVDRVGHLCWLPDGSFGPLAHHVANDHVRRFFREAIGRKPLG